MIELPFVVLAVLLPFTGPDPRIDVLGLALSEPGLLGAWNIVVEGHARRADLADPGRDHAAARPAARDAAAARPGLVVTIATLMLRYADLIVAEAGRMRRARLSRGHDPRFLWQVGATARGVGALFVRAYERGERVHLAMLSRGFDGAHAPAPRTAPRAGGSGSRAWPRRGVARGAGGGRLERGVTVHAPRRLLPRPAPRPHVAPPSLDVAGLAFAYPDGHQALHGVDLRVGPGERVALLGPNGAGKTTLVLHLNGILRAGAGTRRRGRAAGGARRT